MQHQRRCIYQWGRSDLVLRRGRGGHCRHIVVGSSGCSCAGSGAVGRAQSRQEAQFCRQVNVESQAGLDALPVAAKRCEVVVGTGGNCQATAVTDSRSQPRPGLPSSKNLLSHPRPRHVHRSHCHCQQSHKSVEQRQALSGRQWPILRRSCGMPILDTVTAMLCVDIYIYVL